MLISENYWQQRFAGDPAALGKSIRLSGAVFTIVGITPANFTGTSVAVPNFWLPLVFIRWCIPTPTAFGTARTCVVACSVVSRPASA